MTAAWKGIDCDVEKLLRVNLNSCYVVYHFKDFSFAD